MSFSFTEYVRGLDTSGAPPDEASFTALLDALRSALVWEMQKRSAWRLPPSYLGVLGNPVWDRYTLDELLFECYDFTFFRRLNGLRRQALVKPSIDGLVYRNIRNFLHELQGLHDPLGTRIYKILNSTLAELCHEKVLFVLDGDPRLRGDTVLGFGTKRDGRDAEGVDFTALAREWNEDLLVRLMSAWSDKEVINELKQRIRTLPEHRITVFRVRDLLVPLRDDARARWGLIRQDPEIEYVKEGEGDLAEIIQIIRPGEAFEALSSFRALVLCVSAGIDRLEERVRTKDYLHRLWLYLRDWASEEGPIDKIPPDRSLSEALKIPRDRIPGLRATLGKLARRCRGEEVLHEEAPPSQILAQGAGDKMSAHAVGRSPMSGENYSEDYFKNRREELRLRAGNVPAVSPASTDRTVPGDVYLFPETGDHPVEWVVLEEDAHHPERVLVVPLDDYPLVGSCDSSLADGVRVLRCSRGAWIDSSACPKELRGESLGNGEVEAALRLRSEASQNLLAVSTSAREVDEDPEYRLWLEELDAARAALPGHPRRDAEEQLAAAAASKESSPKVVDLASRRQAQKQKILHWSGWAVAASLLPILAFVNMEARDAQRHLEQASLPSSTERDEVAGLRPTDRAGAEVISVGGRLKAEIFRGPAEDFQYWRIEISKNGLPVSTENYDYSESWFLDFPYIQPGEEFRIDLYGWNDSMPETPLRSWILKDGQLKRMEIP